MLAAYYRHLIAKADAGYYLFAFTDGELTEIVAKPDEWGEFDYQLALHLLAERGIEIQEVQLEGMQQARLDELAQPEPVPKSRIVQAYGSALFGGIFAIFFGYHLAYSYKILRDGTQVYSHDAEDRKHGERILVVGVVCLVVWMVVIVYLRTR